jgi:hypothetical protein
VGFTLVIANPTGTTMRLRQLWWDWNPVRLRRLLAMKDGQINANLNLTARYYQDMLTAKLSLDKANQMLDVVMRELKVLRYELEATEDAQNDS